LVSRSNIKQQITKPGDIKMSKKAAKEQKKGLTKRIKKGKAMGALKKGFFDASKVIKKGLTNPPRIKKGKAMGTLKKEERSKDINKKKNGGGLSPVKAKELNNIMNASQGIAENLQKQSMVSRKRGGIVNGNDLVSSYYE